MPEKDLPHTPAYSSIFIMYHNIYYSDKCSTCNTATYVCRDAYGVFSIKLVNGRFETIENHEIVLRGTLSFYQIHTFDPVYILVRV